MSQALSKFEAQLQRLIEEGTARLFSAQDLKKQLAALGFHEAQTMKLIAAGQVRDALPLRPLRDGDVIRVSLPLSEDHSVHGEFVVDAEAKLARFYVLGEDLKTPVEATAVTMHAEGENGEEKEVTFEPAGGEKAGEFTVALDQLPSSDIEQLFGHFHVTVNGEELHGDLAHDHDHAHEHEHEHAEGEAAPQ